VSHHQLPTPEAQDILIVGASGDLTRRKLLPALYNLFISNLLPDGGDIIGMARTEMDTQSFKDLAHDAVKQFSRTGIDEDAWQRFATRLLYRQTSDGGFDHYARESKVKKRVAYLAIPPTAVDPVLANLAQADLVNGTKLICEKPFGEDLDSARKLNHDLHQYFDESQLFRIDHYLGKETVQNILVFRFGNSVFERVWNRDAIQRIEITVAESLGMEGRA